MKLVQPMKYVVVQERPPKDGTGREPNRALVIFDARISSTVICAGVSREHALLSDCSIVEEGDYNYIAGQPTPYSGDEVESIRRAGQQALKAYQELRFNLNAALGVKVGTTEDAALKQVEQLRQDSESLARVNEALKAAELRVSHSIERPLKVPKSAVVRSAHWREGFKAGADGEGVAHNPYVEGYSAPFVEANEWEAGRQAGVKARANVQ